MSEVSGCGHEGRGQTCRMEDSRLGDTEAAHGGACVQVHIGLYPGGCVNEESPWE